MNDQKRVGRKWTEESALKTILDVRGVKRIGEKELSIPEGSLGLRRLGARDYLQRVVKYGIVVERRRRR